MGKKVIIIADDIEMSRVVVKKFLGSVYEVLEAKDGLEVLEILESHKVDGIILDIIMPGMDGIEVLKKIRAQEKFDNIGILVATSTKEKTERMALQNGADDIVAKPYDPVVIKKRVENMLAKKSMELLFSSSDINEQEKLFRQSFIESYSDKLTGELDKLEKSVGVMKDNIDNASVIVNSIDVINERIKMIRELVNINTEEI